MFDRASIIEGATLRPAPGAPVTLGESISSSYGAMSETELSLSGEAAIHGEWESLLDTVRKQTGERFPNPRDAHQYRSSLKDPRVRETEERRIFGELTKLKTIYPDLPVLSPEDIRRKIADRRREVRKTRAKVAERETGTVSWLGPLIGGGGAAITDPPVLASLFFGAPLASGILKTALIEARIGAASEILVQGQVQGSRRQFGERPSMSQAVENIGLATVGGGVFGGMLRALGRGGAAVRREASSLVRRADRLPEQSTAVEDALAHTRRRADLEDVDPFVAAGRAEHVERMTAAEIAIREGRVADLGEPVHPVRKDVLETVPHVGQLELSERAKAAVLTLQPLIGERARFGAFIEELRSPRAKVADAQTLLGFLRAEGGLRPDPELRALGITPRQFPGLLRKTGRTLDDAGLRAAEGGFFERRPDISELLDAIDEQINRGRPLRRLEAEGRLIEREALDDLGEALGEAGIDIHRMTPEEVARAVDRMSREIATAAQDRGMGEAAVSAARVADDPAPATDDILRAEVEQIYADRMDDTIWIEGNDGSPQQVTVRELLEAIERDQDDLEALRVCVGGGR